MRLPFEPPLEPMLAKLSAGMPEGEGWLYEPKWDGFRAIVFRDRDEVYIQSRDLKPLDRYFPELPPVLRANLPERCVVDGEIVIPGTGGLEFESLLLRIHPAASRVNMLAEQTPASFVAWDLLALGDEDLRSTPQGDRRARIEAEMGTAQPPVHLTPATRDVALARDWFDRFEGAGLDGVVAKSLSAPYQPGKRAMLKIKHARTADCVVAGFRWHKNGPGTHVGSLLLGLYDDDGKLHHVGITSSFSWERRAALVEELAPLRTDATEGPSLGGVGRVVQPGPGGRERAAHARRDQPLESGQGPVLGAAAHRARGRGCLRPSSGRPVPSRHDICPLAARQTALGLPLRPAGDNGAVRAGPDLRRFRVVNPVRGTPAVRYTRGV